MALFTSVLHNVFLLYYVDTFVSVYKINKLSFWVGEVGLAWGCQSGWETRASGFQADRGAGFCPSVRHLGHAVLFSRTQPEKLAGP